MKVGASRKTRWRPPTIEAANQGDADGLWQMAQTYHDSDLAAAAGRQRDGAKVGVSVLRSASGPRHHTRAC